MNKKVIITSENPTKINAVKSAFGKMFPSETFEFDCVSASSDVSDQPMGSEETLRGAKNRVNNAKLKFQDANYYVGIEGGIEKLDGEMEVFAWAVVESKNTKGKSRTATFFLPKKVIKFIEVGAELGEASDIVFGQINAKQKNGAIGILTDDNITRTDALTDAVILALIPFKNFEIY